MASGTTSSARPGVTPGPYFKVTIFFRKRADLTDDYFHTYWRKNHCDLALDSKVFMGKVRRYSQHHVTPDMKAAAKKVAGDLVLDYDGYAEFWLDCMEDWITVCSDKAFAELVTADEVEFIERPWNIMFGWDNLIIGDEWTVKSNRDLS